ncbi:MAG: 2-phosphosulfolactate phosphatase [Bacteroidales bacterium]|nr:2-phosphosulfolactate phosphatase [Bacteroidales bacterium]
MQIRILHLTEGAKQAEGLAVIIDVFRAFSLACYLFQNGAKRIIPVADVEEAYRLKAQHPEYILIGERNERKLPGFDFGNSPTHIEHVSFKGKTIVHTTSAGTQGIVNARNAADILTGSFVNASAIVRYIKTHEPPVVSLVCMGYSATEPADEDLFCAEYIRNELEGKHTDFDHMVKLLRAGSGRRLLDPANQLHSPARDFELCLALNRFDFVLKVNRSANPAELEKICI